MEPRPLARTGLLSDRRLAPEAVGRAPLPGRGINTYVGLWKGPTEEQLDELEGGRHVRHLRAERRRPEAPRRPDDRRLDARRRAGQRPVARPAARATARRSRRPRSSRTTSRSARPTPTAARAAQPGQGVAWDGWYGRGVRTNHPEDYPRVPQGLRHRLVRHLSGRPREAARSPGKLWYVPHGVERLREWTEDARTVWNCIEMHADQQSETQADAGAGAVGGLDGA